MALKDFFERKHTEIIEFVEKYAKEMDADEAFRKRVNDRLKSWLLLETIVNDNMTIEEFQKACKTMDLEGSITFMNQKFKNKIRVIPDDAPLKKEKDTVELRASEVNRLVDIAMAFDAEVVDIK
jgi:hypothetical protein